LETEESSSQDTWLCNANAQPEQAVVLKYRLQSEFDDDLPPSPASEDPPFLSVTLAILLALGITLLIV
jgi:hypothetical protein